MEVTRSRYSHAAKRIGVMLRDPAWHATAVTELRELLAAHGWNTVHAARASGIGLRTLCRWASEYPLVRAAVEQARVADGLPRLDPRSPRRGYER